MNILKSLRVYGKWALKDSRVFNDEEKSSVSNAVVVDSDYGKSVCFFMKGGGSTYIPLSENSTLGVGDSVDMNKAKVLTLCKEGEADILRIEA